MSVSHCKGNDYHKINGYGDQSHAAHRHLPGIVFLTSLSRCGLEGYRYLAKNDIIRNLTRQITDYENYHHTGNEYADIILRDKARLAQRKQIDFHAAVCFEEGGFVEPLDISTILGNALDNAIEACEKLPKDERLITVKAGRIRDLLTISVENTAPDAPASTSQRGIPGPVSLRRTFLTGEQKSRPPPGRILSCMALACPIFRKPSGGTADGAAPPRRTDCLP